MVDRITTERLVLRAPEMADAPAVAREANNVEITRWLTQLPQPYGLKDAQDFIARQTSGKTFLICKDDVAIGCIGTVGEFGYWLGVSHWGKGYCTEAARAVLDWHFTGGGETLSSGHALGNQRSRNVLVKMGFRDVDVTPRTHKITGAVRQQQNMTLTKADWERVQ